MRVFHFPEDSSSALSVSHTEAVCWSLWISSQQLVSGCQSKRTNVSGRFEATGYV